MRHVYKSEKIDNERYERNKRNIMENVKERKRARMISKEVNKTEVKKQK